MTPKISVIMPYYRKRQYILKAIKSVLSQSYKNFEIIIIYDDIDLNDLNYLKKLFKKNNKIKFIVNNKNIGAGFSRNRGIKISKGAYIAFLDSDDYWHKDKLKLQLNFMINKKLLISHTNFFIIDKKSKIIGKFSPKKFITYKYLLKSCDIGLSTVIIKKKLMIKYKFPNIKTKEDYIVWLKIIKKTNKFLCLNKYLTFWRDTPNSLSSSLIQRLKDGFILYYKHEKKNFFNSIFLIFQLSFYALIKKTTIKFK